jgi:hypothetical protein
MTLENFNKLAFHDREQLLFKKGNYIYSFETQTHVVLCIKINDLIVEAHYPHGTDVIEMIQAVRVEVPGPTLKSPDQKTHPSD